MPSKRVPKKQKKSADPKPVKKHASAKKETAKQTSAKPAQRSAPKTRKSRKISWRPIIIVACIVVFVIALMYPVGREYYQTLRKEQRLQAQIDAYAEQQEALEAQNEALSTPDGIESAGIEQGLVKEGEILGIVTGIPDSDNSASALSTHLDKDEITAPKTWYYSVLDFIFFVHE